MQDMTSSISSSKKDESYVKVSPNTVGSGDERRTGIMRGFIDSFRRGRDVDLMCKADAEDGTTAKMKKTIKTRHLLMITLGTGIGTGLLVGNGSALAKAGPAGLILGYVVSSAMLYLIVEAAGELGICYSGMTGNYTAYSSLLVDPAMGFSVSWVYCIQWMTVFPLQLVTAAMIIQYWTDINPDIFVAIIYAVIVFINLFGAKGYAEAEFFFNLCKVLMIIGFVILGVVINCGGAGTSGYIGDKYWHEPRPFMNGFKGLCFVFCYAAFAYGGIEVMVLSASEQENPRKSISSACKKVIYRIVLIYLLTTVIVCFLVPADHPSLASEGSRASPLVIAVSFHGVKIVPHIINAVILIAVVSVGNSSLYSAPRLLLSLAEQGYAPKIFTYIDRQGRPLPAFFVAMVFGLLAFLAASPAQDDVFGWLLAISGLSQMFIWMSICISHIRFRDAMKAQGRSMGEVGYKARTGYWGSWIAVVTAFLILIAQFWVAISPVETKGVDARSFFQSYLAFPILLLAYFGYKIYHKDWRICIPASEVDLISHRQVFDEDELKQEDLEWKLKLKSSPIWVRIYHFWC
ncbi:AGR040Cp [Eremothecium gossypii ATCC 10895]|uniref:AGR040Cp n=1 Tax=Eremothecium gossypii (strain ATCC 10895 / CBS 109.51 / FGSC 9923 / NRRL Y-1056) TaxID=284811 RepID=Q750B7_EREGS|nr:AGR040Cp [Eremothecium gossypii ATCC 10895]AAS54529.1 AGR040Cp [Eremothecium gossypii ATCC 10895]AEY98861.1 FAGR040Cp [Eremothecium gossypii FDAG1]